MTGSFRVASFGGIAWLWTLGFIGVFLFFASRGVLDIASGRQPDGYDVGVSIFLLPIIVYGWIRSVKAYSVADDTLVIERRGPGRVHIPLGDIERAEASPDLGSFFNSGFLSIGGLFGWAGKAHVRSTGQREYTEAEIYGTNPDKSVVLRMKDGRVMIVTPNDPAALVSTLRVSGMGAALAQEDSYIRGRENKSKRSRKG